MQALSDVDGLREVLLEQIDILAEAGYRSPIGEVSLGDTKSICNVVSLHYGLLSVKAELDQMRSGLMHNSGQFMKFIEESPDEFEPFFHAVGGQPDLTAGMFPFVICVEKSLHALICSNPVVIHVHVCMLYTTPLRKFWFTSMQLASCFQILFHPYSKRKNFQTKDATAGCARRRRTFGSKITL